MPHDQKLNEAQRDQIVVRLAAFEAPIEICWSLQRELGIKVTRQYICRLDPTLNPKWPEKRRRRFFAVREAILREKGEADAEYAMRGRSRERKVLRAAKVCGALPTSVRQSGRAREVRVPVPGRIFWLWWKT